jgi:hypothetical protein
MGADTAALAVIQVSFEIAVFGFINGHVRTENVAHAAPDTFGPVYGRAHGFPVARPVGTGAACLVDNAAYCQILPGKFFF